MVLATEESRPRRMTILGSTGSVGVNTVDLVERHPDDFIVEALTANRNVCGPGGTVPASAPETWRWWRIPIATGISRTPLREPAWKPPPGPKPWSRRP